MFSRGMGTGGCKRCSFCSIHYPPHSKHDVCEACQEPTCFFSNVQPDEDWKEKVEYAKAKPAEKWQADPELHRFDQFLRLGFGLDEAQKLTNAVYGKYGMPLYPGLVAQAIDGGCDLAQALDIFA